MVIAIFWLSLIALVYIYLGYPIAIGLLAAARRRPVAKAPVEPSVTILIAAYNEAHNIAATIENKLALDYPRERLQLIVVSDGSSDGTDDIANRYASQGVLVLRQERRSGKTAALNAGVSRAAGDILVFSDANSLYAKDAIRQLVRNFADPAVGYVTGRLNYMIAGQGMAGAGCSLYMRYENLIRTLEGRLGSIVGVNGGIDAVRRTLYEPMRPDQLPDLILPLHVVERGFRAVYEPDALAYEPTLGSAHEEYRMRVRVALRALWALLDKIALLRVWRHGIYSIQLFSHKVLRYLAFVFILALAVSSFALWSVGPFYPIAALLIAIFLGCAALGAVAERHHYHSRLLYVAYYFVLINLAASAAFLKFLSGQRSQVWQPRLG